MVRIIIFFLLLFISSKTISEQLNNQDKIFFSFLDLNYDKKIPLDKLNQSIKIIFKLIDKNRNCNLSESENFELKNMIESFS